MTKNNITAEQVKKLREQTGAGVMEAKGALSESGGDVEKAIKFLRERGALKAAKKGSRATGQGVIDAYIHGDGRIGVLLEVGVETDFVARNQDFKALVHDLALHIAANEPQSVGELLAQPFVRNAGVTVQQLIDQKIATIGENIKVKRFTRYVLGE